MIRILDNLLTSSYMKWNYKTACIRSLIFPAVRICSPNKLSAEFKFATYNRYPKNVVNATFKKCETTDGKNKRYTTLKI